MGDTSNGGRALGVGFRWFTRDRGVALGLTGFVRNLPDGAVEAVVEGDRAALEAWICHVCGGPPMSRVLTCSVETSMGPTGEYATFDIIR